MNYVKINEQRAIDLGIIKPVNFYRKKDGEVIFSEDVLNSWLEKGNRVGDLDYELLTTEKALEIYSAWQKQA
ncbi:hypothetical protein [Sphingobacterium thalpophilum]|uniref:hypothetical protein n=1 Tax=Sphingobacterium thalpophilum TaxID=259 RepID=UPI0024A71D97|nr:hypothetical protein [Sphingobacterium thalpophilum]